MKNTNREDRTKKFLKILEPLGFIARSSGTYSHPIVPDYIDLTAMADLSTVIKQVFEAGVKQGKNLKAIEIRSALYIRHTS